MIDYDTLKKTVRRWWESDMESAKALTGFKMTRGTAVMLVLSWVSTLATGMLLWAVGLNGYSAVSAAVMVFSCGAVINRIGGQIKEED